MTDERLIILRNIRTLIQGRIKQPDNWVLITKIFGCGFTRAYKLCLELGIDPESKSCQIVNESPTCPSLHTDEGV